MDVLRQFRPASQEESKIKLGLCQWVPMSVARQLQICTSTPCGLEDGSTNDGESVVCWAGLSCVRRGNNSTSTSVNGIPDWSPTRASRFRRWFWRTS